MSLSGLERYALLNVLLRLSRLGFVFVTRNIRHRIDSFAFDVGI